MKKLHFFLLVLSCHLAVAQTQWSNNRLTIENAHIKHTISLEKGKIFIEAFSKEANQELLEKDNSVAWFEFSVNRKLITALQPNWKYVSHNSRKMSNGGEEVSLRLANTKEKGLQVIIFRQYFPASSLIREQLIIENVAKSQLALTKWQSKLHFKFPQYNFVNGIAENSLKEIRIATFGKEQLLNFDKDATYDDRSFDNGYFFNLAHLHAFHPDIRYHKLAAQQKIAIKGSMQFLHFGKYRIFSSYEHASQDDRRGFYRENTQQESAITVDAAQGVEGESGLVETDDDFWFIAMNNQKKEKSIVVANEILRGGYLDGELITAKNPYNSVWSATALLLPNTSEKSFLHQYLWCQITEHAESRKQHFYYNTWGMQRDNHGNGDALRDIFTEERILKEIDAAAELGVDIFVLDDGWEEMQGVWQPNKSRLKKGLKPLVQRMKQHHIIPGIWLSPMGIDSTAERYKQHYNWVIKDKNGIPIKAQWGHPAFDFVSDFYDLFLQDCKALIDEGCLFFKWDAINTFNSTVANLHHGDNRYTPQEIKERYDYMLPFYVTKTMRELREYNPKVVIELDVTEPERCMVGLMPLQEGKFFWMNNGASGYGDYSTYRAKSMRSILHLYDSIIPYGLFTYAVYPHNVYPFFAQRYNLNTTLVGGKGFWGNLMRTTEEQRLRIGKSVDQHKRILPFITDLPIEIIGKIGASPEIFTQLNRASAAGQVIGFSGAVTEYLYETNITAENCLAVLRHKYEIENDKLTIPFQFTMPDDTREAFIIPNNGTGITIAYSTVWLEEVQLGDNELHITHGSAGKMRLNIPEKQNVRLLDERANSIAAVLEKEGNNAYLLTTQKSGKIVLKWD